MTNLAKKCHKNNFNLLNIMYKPAYCIINRSNNIYIDHPSTGKFPTLVTQYQLWFGIGFAVFPFSIISLPSLLLLKYFYCREHDL